MKIFLDDERVPVEEGWTVARSFGEYHRLVLLGGSSITHISFDHDLGLLSLDGYACVHWLIDLAMDEPDLLTGLHTIMFHTANLTGLENMRSLLANAQKHGILSDVELVPYSCLFHSDHAIMPNNFDITLREE